VQGLPHQHQQQQQQQQQRKTNQDSLINGKRENVRPPPDAAMEAKNVFCAKAIRIGY